MYNIKIKGLKWNRRHWVPFPFVRRQELQRFNANAKCIVAFALFCDKKDARVSNVPVTIHRAAGPLSGTHHDPRTCAKCVILCLIFSLTHAARCQRYSRCCLVMQTGKRLVACSAFVLCWCNLVQVRTTPVSSNN